MNTATGSDQAKRRVLGCLRLAARLLGTARRWLTSPLGLLILGVTIGLWAHHYGVPLLTIVAGWIVAVPVVWAWWRPESFRRCVLWRLRGRWRRRGLRRRWTDAVSGCGLVGRQAGGTIVFPGIGPVLSSRHTDRFHTVMPMGHTIEHWSAKSQALAVGLNAEVCRIRTPARRRTKVLRRRVDRRMIELQLIRRDVLTDSITAHEPDADPVLGGLPVALTEDGHPYRLPLLGTHLLIAGATGAGKGAVLWSIMRQLAPAIHAGQVRVIGVDPKALELPFGARLFHQVVDGDAETIADGLEQMVTVLDQRKQAMRGKSRLHTPTRLEPFYVVMIDEIAAITAYVTDRNQRKRIEAALGLLLSQGRAPGVSVIGALQDPRKEVLALRNLFPLRLALRLSEPGEVDMVLGDGARARGATCDQIPTAMPGTGYVVVEDRPEPVRVRFPFTSDTDIAHLARTYPAPHDATVTNVSPLRTGDRGGEAA